MRSRSIATTRRAEASRGVNARGDGAYARAIRARSRSIVRWNSAAARVREPGRAVGESRVRGGMRERCARARTRVDGAGEGRRTRGGEGNARA